MNILLLLALSIPGAVLVSFLWRSVVGHSGKCDHFFPERGIGCSVCDEYYWHRDGEALRELEADVARLKDAVFPLDRRHHEGACLPPCCAEDEL